MYTNTRTHTHLPMRLSASLRSSMKLAVSGKLVVGYCQPLFLLYGEMSLMVLLSPDCLVGPSPCSQPAAYTGFHSKLCVARLVHLWIVPVALPSTWQPGYIPGDTRRKLRGPLFSLTPDGFAFVPCSLGPLLDSVSCCHSVSMSLCVRVCMLSGCMWMGVGQDSSLHPWLPSLTLKLISH